MSDKGDSKKETYAGSLPKSKRKALIEAAANQAADKAIPFGVRPCFQFL